VFSQSEILQEEVYLFERLEVETRDIMAHLKACVLVRPTEENIAHLKRELRTPKYGEYYLCMCPSNPTTKPKNSIVEVFFDLFAFGFGFFSHATSRSGDFTFGYIF
jgi:hypothetical protein